jgi:CRP-like cAMP-binding protein
VRAGADSESTDTLRLAHVDLLSRIDVFEHLDRVALARLAGYLEPRSLHDGEVVFQQGDPADGLYIVARGVVCIYGLADNGRPQTILATAARGQYFGEIALIVDESRTASVRAVGDAEVLCLERARFVDLIRRNPSVALAITAKVIGHLRSADRARSTRQDATEGAGGAPVQVVDRPSALVDDLRATDDYPKAARSRLWTGTCLALSAVFGLGALAGALRSVDHVGLFVLLLGTAATLWPRRGCPRLQLD